ncbi:hypothetical protein JHK85_010063 [Glycine max]|nr:hypothetical protein JHK85_010063 [Glycine max]
MARTPNEIKFIDGSRETLKLAVRITNLWFVGTPNKSEQAEMVIVDSDGDEIHAICKPNQLKSWKIDLKENCTYVMHNFKVMKNDGQFRVCSSQLSSNDAFLSKAEAKTIAEINVISKIGQSADEVNRVKIEEGDVDLNASPQALDRLLGYVLAFKVKVQPKFRNVVVLRYSNELDLINVVLDMLPDTETCSKVDIPNLDCNDAP